MATKIIDRAKEKGVTLEEERLLQEFAVYQIIRHFKPDPDSKTGQNLRLPMKSIIAVRDALNTDDDVCVLNSGKIARIAQNMPDIIKQGEAYKSYVRAIEKGKLKDWFVQNVKNKNISKRYNEQLIQKGFFGFVVVTDPKFRESIDVPIEELTEFVYGLTDEKANGTRDVVSLKDGRTITSVKSQDFEEVEIPEALEEVSLEISDKVHPLIVDALTKGVSEEFYRGFYGDDEEAGISELLSPYLRGKDTRAMAKVLENKDSSNRSMMISKENAEYMLKWFRYCMENGLSYEIGSNLSNEGGKLFLNITSVNNTYRINIYSTDKNQVLLSDQRNTYKIDNNLNFDDYKFDFELAKNIFEFASGKVVNQIFKNAGNYSSGVSLTESNYLPFSYSSVKDSNDANVRFNMFPRKNYYDSTLFIDNAQVNAESEKEKGRGKKSVKTESRTFINGLLKSGLENFNEALRFDDIQKLVFELLDKDMEDEELKEKFLELSCEDGALADLQMNIFQDLILINSYDNPIDIPLDEIKAIADFEKYHIERFGGENTIEVFLQNYREILNIVEIGSRDEYINPVGLEKYASFGDRANTRSSLIIALIRAGYDKENIISNGFSGDVISDKIIKFDEDKSYIMGSYDNPEYSDVQNEYCNSVMEYVNKELLDRKIKNPLIEMDEQGIIRWTGSTVMSFDKDSFETSVSGTIGQVFPPNEDGIVRTNFVSSEDFYFVPAYEGYFTSDGLLQGDTVRERLRVRGFDQVLKESITQTLSLQLSSPAMVLYKAGSDEKVIDLSTELDSSALTRLYRGELYGSRLSRDYYEETLLDDGTKKALLESLTHKIAFPKIMGQNCTTDSARRWRNLSEGKQNDFGEGSLLQFALVDCKNMRVVDKERFGGLVDLSMIGSDNNQGLSLYLAEGAKINEDGSITPSEDIDAHCVLGNIKGFEYREFCADDRLRMAGNQLGDAKRIAHDAKVAYTTLGCFTFDDAYVVSKEFAEKNGVIENGEIRSLQRGDKLSCFGGNKGIISFVIDRDMPERLAKKKGLWEAVKFFKENRGLDVVCAPYGIMSRDNASIIRKAMREPDDLIMPDGSIVKGLVTNDFIIPHQTVDEKTTLYEGKNEGRKLSHQLMWAYASKGAKKSVQYFFKNSEKMMSNMNDLRDYMNVLGLDLDENMKMRIGYKPHVLEDGSFEERGMFVLEFPKGTSTIDYFSGMFDKWLSDNSGFLMIPKDEINVSDEYRKMLSNLEMKLKSDKDVKARIGLLNLSANPDFKYIQSSKSDYGKSVDETMIEVSDKDGNKISKNCYKIPVMKASLRNATTSSDGSFIKNDYTIKYSKMVRNLMMIFALNSEFNKFSEEESHYLNTIKQYLEGDILYGDGVIKAIKKLNANTSRYNNSLKGSVGMFNDIQKTVIERNFNGTSTGKGTFFRDKLYALKRKNSATMVLMPDPNLKIDEVGMDKEVMKSLGVKEGDKILEHRDPVLTDGAVRYVRVKHDPKVHGISINPMCDKSLDGDFDGDTLGGFGNIRDKEVQKELENAFGYVNNLLDFKSPPDENGNYNLYFNTSMDYVTAESSNPDLIKLREEIKFKANNKYRLENYRGSCEETEKLGKECIEMLNQYSDLASKSLSKNPLCINFESPQTIYEGFKKMALEKSKGNLEKLAELCDYVGFEVDDNGKVIDTGKPFCGKFNESGKDLHSVKAEGIQFATGVKTDNTGKAGVVQQKFIACLRDICPKDALDTIYNVTQGNLQIKHDPVQAVAMDKVLSEDLPMVLNGQDPYKKIKVLNQYTGKLEQKPEPLDTSLKFANTLYKLLSDEEVGLGIAVQKNKVLKIAKGLEINGDFATPKQYMPLKSSVIDYLVYGSNSSVRSVDIMRMCAEKNLGFHDNMDGSKNDGFCSSYIPEKFEVIEKKSSKEKRFGRYESIIKENDEELQIIKDKQEGEKLVNAALGAVFDRNFEKADLGKLYESENQPCDESSEACL